MEKLAKLSSKEESGDQNLSGLVKITMDVYVTEKTGNASVLKELAKVMGDVKDITIERYATESPFDVGDTIELTADFTCDKSVYLDTSGNLVISDKPVSSAVEKVGEFSITLPAGTLAEVNSKLTKNATTEVLFTGEEIHLDDLDRTAYLGILELPSTLLSKSI